MKATIQSTDQVVDINAVGHPGKTKARVWEGVTGKRPRPPKARKGPAPARPLPRIAPRGRTRPV